VPGGDNKKGIASGRSEAGAARSHECAAPNCALEEANERVRAAFQSINDGLVELQVAVDRRDKLRACQALTA
jgi:hypothetical protein